MPFVTGIVVRDLRRADAVAAGRDVHQDEADDRQRALRRRAARRPLLRPPAPRLRARRRRST